mgnify:CR=1 FL=1
MYPIDYWHDQEYGHIYTDKAASAQECYEKTKEPVIRLSTTDLSLHDLSEESVRNNWKEPIEEGWATPVFMDDRWNLRVTFWELG